MTHEKQSTKPTKCIHCGADFDAPKNPGMTRKICDPCRPIRKAEILKRWRAEVGTKHSQIRYRKVVKGLDKDYALIERMRERQDAIDREFTQLRQQRMQARGITAEQQQARADVEVAMQRIGLGKFQSEQ